MKKTILDNLIMFKAKHTLFQLSAFVSFGLFVVCFQSLAYGLDTKALLWKVDKNGVDSSYIFATMHSEDSRIVTLSKKVKLIFAQSKSFTAEIDLSLDVSATVSNMMLLPRNKSLRLIVGNDLFEKTVDVLKKFNIPEKFVNKMKPWAVMMTLSYPKPKTGLYLDKILFNNAIKVNKPYYGLETVQEQLAIFNNISYPHQVILLRDTIAQYSKFGEQLEKLKSLYLSENLDGIHEYNTKIMLNGNFRVAKKFMDVLIDKRNRTMVQRMQLRLREGGAFIAVGALHLPGNKGILQLLREQHYQLTAIKKL